MSNIVKVQEYFSGNIERIQEACTGVKMPEQIMDAVQVIAKNTKLQQCTPSSIVGAVITASRLGVSLDPNIKHSYLIPYGKECKLEISYMGFIDVIYQTSGALIEAHMVYANDVFDYQQGDKPTVTHKPEVFGDRGELKGCYAICKFPNGQFSIEFLSVSDIEQCRKVSKNPNGVWKTWFEEMAKKSAIRRLYKRIPKPRQAAAIARYDEKSEIGEDTSEFYDIDGVEIPQEQTATQQLDDLTK